MAKQEDFFSRKHNQLLNIATWSKYLAWIVLIFYLLYAIASLIQQIGFVQELLVNPDFVSAAIKQEPLFFVNALLGSCQIILSGIALFLTLRGISLGLAMIVETNINYREAKRVEAEND
jgi:hypothetical protein